MVHPEIEKRWLKFWGRQAYRWSIWLTRLLLFLLLPWSRGGTVIRQYSSISSDAVIGENTLIQPYVHISYDVHVGANTVFSANVALGGKLQIGEECYFGLGAVVCEELTIGARAIIGMGAVVLHDVDCDSIMVGNPAHVLRKNATGEVFHHWYWVRKGQKYHEY